MSMTMASANPPGARRGAPAGGLDVERDSDLPISTQIYWQLAYQIDSGRLLPGSRLPPVRELGAALRVNPNTIRAVYRRLADAGYVTSRHGAGTHVADRPPQRRGAEALAGVVAEMLRRAAHAGFTADEVAAATFAAATERKRPGSARPRPLRRVHERRCRLRRRTARRRVPRLIEVEGALIDDLPERLERFHYDLSRRRPSMPTRPRSSPRAGSRSWRCSSAPAISSSSTRSPGCRPGRGWAWSAPRSAARRTCSTSLRLSGTPGVEIVHARSSASPTRSRPSTRASDLILMSREALAAGLDRTGPPITIGSGPGPTSSTRPGWSSCGERSSTSPPNGRRRPPAPDATPSVAACHPSAMRDFHVRRTARERYAIDDDAARRPRRPRRRRLRRDPRLAARMNADSAARRRVGTARARSGRSACSTRSATC